MNNSVRRIPKRPIISPLRYPGGKAGLYSVLREILRHNGLAGCTYIEPYAGGAGVGLALLVTGQVSRIVINDLDPSIAAFWRTLVDDPSYLIHRVRTANLDVDEWRRQKCLYMNPSSSDERELGFATFYLNRTNRSGVLNGGPIGGVDQSGEYKIDARFNKDTLCERIRTIGLYSKKITVMSEDGRDVIDQFTRSPRTFLYADPPYFDKAGSLYLNAFTSSDHENLANILNRRPRRKWVLTYDNVPLVDELYSSRRRSRIDLYYSAHRVTRAQEIMVFSDTIRS